MPRPDSGFLSGVLAGINQFKQTKQFYEQMESTNLQQEATRAQMAAFKQQQADYESPTTIRDRELEDHEKRLRLRTTLEQEQYDRNRTRAGELPSTPEGVFRLPTETGGWQYLADPTLSAKAKLKGMYQIKPGDLKTLEELMENSITNLGFTERDFPGVVGLPEDVHRKAMAQLTGGAYPDFIDGKQQLVQWSMSDPASAVTTLYTSLLENDPQIVAFARRITDRETLNSIGAEIGQMAFRRAPISDVRREVQRLSFEAVPSEQTGLGEAAERLAAQPIASIESIGPYAKFIAGTMVSDVPGLEDKGTALQDESFRSLMAIHGHNINKSLEYLKAENLASGTIQAFIKFLLRTGKLTSGTQGETQGIPVPNIGSRP